MGRQIDERVVKMGFDNAQFENGARQTLGTLDKLKQVLSSKSLNSNVGFNALSSSLSTISSRFTTMGMIGSRIIMNLTDDAYRFAKKGIGTVIGTINEAGKSRAFNIEQAKFQLKGLGVAWKKIEEDISYGVKDTAYGLDSAAKAASQLVASGVKFGKGTTEMKAALRGISGVAAMTNSSYEDISRIFTTVAGNGRVFATELNSLGARGLNAAAVIGKSLGKTETQVRDMASKGQIDFKMFSKAMDDAFGKHAKDANKTFTGAMSNIRAAFGRIGADFYSPMIDSSDGRKFKNFIDVLNKYREKIDELHEATKPFAVSVSNVLSKLSGKVIKALDKIDTTKTSVFFNAATTGMNLLYSAGVKLFRIVGSIIQILSKLIPVKAIFAGIGESMKAVFGSEIGKNIIDNLSDFAIKMKTLSGEVKTNKRLIENFKKIFAGVFTLIQQASVVISPLFGVLKTGASIIWDIFMAVTDVLGNVGASIAAGKSFSNIMKTLAGGLTRAIDGIKNFRKEITGFGTFGINEQLGKLLEKLIVIPGAVAKFVGSFADLSSITALAQGGILYTIVLELQGLVKMINNSINPIGGITDTLNTARVALLNFSKSLKAKTFSNLGSALIKLAIALMILSTIDADRLASALTAAGIAMAEMSLMMNSMNKMGGGSGIKSVLAMQSTMAALNQLAMSMVIVAVTLKILSSMSLGDSLKAVSIMGLAMTEMYLFTKKLSMVDFKGANKQMKAMRSFALSMVILGVAFKILASLSWEGISKSLAAMGGTMLIFGVFMNSLEAAEKKAKTIKPTGIIAMASSILIISFALKRLGDMGWTEIGKGLSSMGVTFFMLITSIKSLDKISSGGKALAASASLVILATSMRVMAGAVRMLGSAGLPTLEKGLGSIGLILGGFVIALNGLSSIGPKVLIASAAIAALTLTLTALIPAILLLGSADISTLSTGLIAMATALGVLVIAGTAASTVAVGLLALGAAIVAIGAGIGLATAGIGALAFGIGTLLSAITGFLTMGIPAFNAFLNNITSFISTIISKIPEWINTIADGIRKHGPAIINAMLNLLKALLEQIITTLKGIIKLLFQYGPIIWGHVKKFIPKLLSTIVNGVKSIWAGIKGYFSNLATNVGNSIKNIGKEGADKVKGWLKGFKDAAVHVVSGFGNKIKEKIKAIPNYFKNLGSSILNKFKNVLGIHSPSREMAKIAEYTLQGFIKGLVSGKKRITSAIDMAFTSTLRQKTSEWPKILRNGVKVMTESFSDTNTSKARKSIMSYAYALYKRTDGYKEDTKAAKENLKTLKDLIKQKSKINSESAKKKKTKSSESNRLKKHQAIDKKIKDAEKKLKDSLYAPVKKMAEAYSKMRDDIKSSLKSYIDVLSLNINTQLDMFKKFGEESEVSSTELLDNMKSQIDGISKWNSDLVKLAEKGFAKEIIEQLRSLGPSATGHIKAFMMMTSEQMEKANEMFSIKAKMSSETLLSDFKTKLLNAKEFANNIKELANRGLNGKVIESLSAKGLEASDYVNAFMNMTTEQLNEFNKTFRESLTLPNQLANNMMTAIAKTTKTKTPDLISVDVVKSTENGKKAAKAFTTGVSQKLDEDKPVVRSKAESIAKEVKSGISIKFNKNTGMKMIDSFSKGMISGFDTNLESVKNAAVSFARSAYNAAMAALNSEMNTQPVISPVLDLSGVKSNVGKVDALINSGKVKTGLAGVSAKDSANGNITFIQNNYSPKALSRTDIYRQTKNQVSNMKGALKKKTKS